VEMTVRAAFSILSIDLANTIVPLKSDFAAQKKGAWPSRPCGDWSTYSHLAHPNQGAHRSTQAGRAVPLSWSPKASGFWYKDHSLTKKYRLIPLSPKE
jgi:hypothetical protein